MNKKAFTLIELLASIIILSILVLTIVPSVSSYMTTARQKSYVSDATIVTNAVKSDAISKRLSPNKIYYYQLEAINSLLSNKLFKSSNNKEYSASSYVKVEVDTNYNATFTVCLSDGENKLEENLNNIGIQVVEETSNTCNPTDTGTEVYANYNDITEEITMDGEPVTGTTTSTYLTGDLDIYIESNMIPVYYDNTESVWKKADNTNTSNNWYDYASGKWANAVTVSDTNRSTYISASSGTTITQSDINGFYVWIPRYEYKINNQEEAISINFIPESQTTPTTGFIIHPAFTFGTEELKGIWMSKYEISGATNDIKILPNVEALRMELLSSFYTGIANMNAASNQYGFNLANQDIHLIKNCEWAAAAYLSQSIKGRCTSSTSCPEVSANLTDYITANSGSTTGNIYGIYDMAGGSWEAVMGQYPNYVGREPGALSGFNGAIYYDENGDHITWQYTEGIEYPDTKYIDLFPIYHEEECTTEICSGQAINETRTWYSDDDSFVYSSRPWMIRGGFNENTTEAGIFAYRQYAGDESWWVGTRAVLTQK